MAGKGIEQSAGLRYLCGEVSEHLWADLFEAHKPRVMDASTLSLKDLKSGRSKASFKACKGKRLKAYLDVGEDQLSKIMWR